MIHLNNIINEALQIQVEDLEKELNAIQEKTFQQRMRYQTKTTSCTLPKPPVDSQPQKIFRKIKPVGNTIIFGDSKSRGLDRGKLAMAIGSTNLESIIYVISLHQTSLSTGSYFIWAPITSTTSLPLRLPLSLKTSVQPEVSECYHCFLQNSVSIHGSRRSH